MEEMQDPTIYAVLLEKFHEIDCDIDGGKKFARFSAQKVSDFLKKGAYIEFSSLIISYAWIPGLTYDRKWFYIVDNTGEGSGLYPDELLRLEYAKEKITTELLNELSKQSPLMGYAAMQLCWFWGDDLHERILYLNFDSQKITKLEAKVNAEVSDLIPRPE